MLPFDLMPACAKPKPHGTAVTPPPQPYSYPQIPAPPNPLPLCCRWFLLFLIAHVGICVYGTYLSGLVVWNVCQPLPSQPSVVVWSTGGATIRGQRDTTAGMTQPSFRRTGLGRASTACLAMGGPEGESNARHEASSQWTGTEHTGL